MPSFKPTKPNRTRRLQWIGIGLKEVGNSSRARSKRSGASSPMTTLLLSTADVTSSKAKSKNAMGMPRIKFVEKSTIGFAYRIKNTLQILCPVACACA
jgi:hypothetical protein